MPGQSLCYGRGLCENFLNISYSLLSWGKAKREDNIHNKRAKTAGADGDGCFPAGAPLGRPQASQPAREGEKRASKDHL